MELIILSLITIIILCVCFYRLGKTKNKAKVEKLQNDYDLLKHNYEISKTFFEEYNKVKNMSDTELNNMLDKLSQTAKRNSK